MGPAVIGSGQPRQSGAELAHHLGRRLQPRWPLRHLVAERQRRSGDLGDERHQRRSARASLGNPGPSWHVKGAGDFNGDGFADILWQNDSGEVAIWEMNGTSGDRRRRLGNPGPDWHAKGTGDFNGDGRADILWQNDSGEAAIWEMNGTAVIGARQSRQSRAGLARHGHRRLQHDGRSDILWQNSSGEVVTWEMNGASVIGGAGLANPGPTWHS